MRTLNLRQLILLLSISAAVLVLANTFYTSHKTQRALLIEQTLEANHGYALKTADNVNNFLLAAQQQLAFAAKDVLLAQGEPQQLQHIVERLKQQTNSFNSVLVLDAEGIALAITQPAQQFLGKKLQNAGAVEALLVKKPLISKPYISVTDHLVVFLTHPVFDGQGTYLGFVGGAIYLDDSSILAKLLGEHYHADDSYLYVVDSDGRLIYHQDRAQIGDVVHDNAVVEQVRAGHTGSAPVLSPKGVEVLAGYAPVPSAGWGVVAQRSLTATLATMKQQMLVVAKYSFPFFILIMLAVWVVSRWISQPLSQLAQSAKHLDSADANTRITGIHVWYFEAFELRRAMLQGLANLSEKMGKLNLETITDPLTGLMNRRGLQVTLEEWEKAGIPFAVVIGDIDHFKSINDEFGHAVGDDVLQFLAQHLHDLSRPGDIVCRFGGEEFVLLFPKISTAKAYKVAERMRIYIENTIHPGTGAPITLSFGIAGWPAGHVSIAQVLKNADEALYTAKEAGRNQVHISAA